MSEMVREVSAIRVGREVSQIDEKIVNDKEVELIVNDTIFGSFSMSPTFLKEFAIGYLLGEGLVDSINNITKINVKERSIKVKINLTDFDIKRELVMSSDCFGGWRHKIEFVKEVDSNYMVSKEDILDAFGKLRKKSKIWKETGGTHIAGLVNNDKFIAIEDVSRHVAVDKVVGAGTLAKVNFSDSFIVCSGRMPADMVMKVARIGIPILASKAAPTSSGFLVGKKSQVTLVGFVRGKRFNIYTHPNRVLL